MLSLPHCLFTTNLDIYPMDRRNRQNCHTTHDIECWRSRNTHSYRLPQPSGRCNGPDLTGPQHWRGYKPEWCLSSLDSGVEKSRVDIMLVVCRRPMQCLHSSCAIPCTTAMYCWRMIHDDDFVSADTKIQFYFCILLVSLPGLVKFKYLLQFSCFNAIVAMYPVRSHTLTTAAITQVRLQPDYTNALWRQRLDT